MPEELFGLPQSEVDLLRDMAAAYLAGELGPPYRGKTRRPMRSADVIFGFLQDSITATTGVDGAPNSGTLVLYEFTSTGGTTATTETETVYHFAPVAATTDRWSFAQRESRTAQYILHFQPCS